MKLFFMQLLLISSTAVSFGQYNSFACVSMDMETKTAKGGFVSSITANIHYGNDGRMTSFYTQPKKYVVLNNAKGEIKIYDQDKNTVIQQQNYLYSTETSQFYFFLNNKKSDLGLQQMGFIQSNISFEEGLMVTEWLPPANMASQVSKVELVLENGNPIFIAYYNNENKISTKSYYYNYIELNPSLTFPSTITQISFSTPTDSTVSKTVYSNVLVDKKSGMESLNFKIPENAKNIQ